VQQPSADLLAEQRVDRFVQSLSGSQTALYAYAAKLLGNAHDAHNVVQQTNLVLWKKVNEFEEGTDFLAWASRIVYYQALAHVRDLKRQRLVFDEELVYKLATMNSAEDVDERRIALRSCLEKLRRSQRDLIRCRYYDGESTKSIAELTGKSQGAVRNSLMRIRQTLSRCIGNKMSAGS
jgi:RNA polymerase sigma-70 factor (ECF subfamily)